MKTKNGMRFGIAFDTLEMPGKIVATTVELGKWVMTEQDTINIALCDHPRNSRRCQCRGEGRASRD